VGIKKLANVSKTYKCACCTHEYKKTEFYHSTSIWYSKNKIIPVCKKCIEKVYNEFLEKFNNNVEIAIYYICANFDFYYDKYYVDVAIRQSAKYRNPNLIGIYFQKVNSLKDIKSFNFSDSKITSENTDLSMDKINSIQLDVEFDKEDEKNKSDVIRLMRYDPFEGYSKFDQKFLYGELVPYLDEDMLDDEYKLSQIIQILNNNNQIRKIDLCMNQMAGNSESLKSSAGDLKLLSSIKKSIVEGNDKIAKENSISVKNRGDKKTGNSTLGGMMKKYRELGFEAEQDYYDMKKAYGMKRAADVSHKSILEQWQFDENDIDDMFKEQRSLLLELQSERDDLKEENRLLKVKVKGLTGG
jgi:hypothetical protein